MRYVQAQSTSSLYKQGHSAARLWIAGQFEPHNVNGDYHNLLPRQGDLSAGQVQKEVVMAIISISGPVEKGDTVVTLHLNRAVEGQVTYRDKKGYCVVEGAHYPGGPAVRVKAHEENLAILKKGQAGE